MIFSTITFLYFFLPIVLGATFLAPQKWRSAILLLASLSFFAWGAPRFVFVLIISCFVDYSLSLGIAHQQSLTTPRISPKLLCSLGVLLNLILLGVFKYTNFAISSLNSFLAFFNIDVSFGILPIALPLGISFFTFQKISYLVDVFRGSASKAPSFARYLLYISLFPQLVLGPIIRYHDIADQFNHPQTSSESFLSGLWRFALGLARKTLIASPLAVIADTAFAQSAAGVTLSPAAAWLGLSAYTLQLYYDFSGYSDMAVGLGRMLGFHFPENFNAPYIAQNMADFWRRWHMTLGSFMKEYLYIPLGGNRCSKARCLLNNWLVFLTSGIWHGASWNFAIWGAWHGFWIMIAKLTHRPNKKRSIFLQLFAILATLFLVMLGWVFFRADSFSNACHFLASLFPTTVLSNSITLKASAKVYSTLTAHSAAALSFGTLFSFLPAILPRLGICDWELAPTAHSGIVFIRTMLTAILLFCASLPLLSSGFNPFIYFKF